MKLIFLAGLDPLLAQGHASHVRHLVDELAARGHQVDVIARDDAGTLSWSPPGRLLRLPRPGIPIAGQLLLELRTAQILRQWIGRDRPDIVLARSETLAFAALSTPPSIPLAVESNASQIEHQREGQNGAAKTPRAWLTGRIERDLFRRAARIGVVAPSLLSIHAEEHRMEASRFFVVRNGAPILSLPDLDTIRSHREAGQAEDGDFVLVLSGSASKRIEFSWVVRAVEANPQARLWVMGQGELWSDWQQLAADSTARERILFLGALSEEDATRYAQSAQVILAPYAENRIESLGGDPLKVLQAMASGRPLLASGLPPDPPFDKIEAGRRISGNAESWIEAVEQWVAEWTHAGSPLRNWPWPDEGPGRDWIRSHRTWSHAAEIWERELQGILPRN